MLNRGLQVNAASRIDHTPAFEKGASLNQTIALQNANPVLELEDISKTFQVRRGFLAANSLLRAVSDVSLSLGSSETLGIVGESGCGKSTLGRIACGLMPPDSGRVLVQGEPLLGPGKQKIQMIFQDSGSALNPRRSIGASVREPLDIATSQAGKKNGQMQQKLSLRERKEQAEQMLDLVGLSKEQGALYPHEFSGGQRQRIVVARALIQNPQVVVCDEPVSSLDASVQAQVLNLLKDLQEKFALAYLFISHDLGVVGHMSDRVAVMYLGRVVELAKVLDIFSSPAHPYTQALLSSQPGSVFSVSSCFTGASGKVKLVGDPPSPVNLPQGCALHPRCPFAMPICRELLPQLKTVAGKNHLSACHLNE